MVNAGLSAEVQAELACQAELAAMVNAEDIVNEAALGDWFTLMVNHRPSFIMNCTTWILSQARITCTKYLINDTLRASADRRLVRLKRKVNKLG